MTQPTKHPPQTALRAFCLGLGVSLSLAGHLMAQTPALPDYIVAEFGNPPPVPDGRLSKDLRQAVEVAFVDSMRHSSWGQDQAIALEEIAASGDPRLVWIISDLMRFAPGRALNAQLADAASRLLNTQISGQNPWGDTTDVLIAWDIPAPPGYLKVKRAIFTTVVPAWDKLFVKGDIDWRHVSVGAAC